MHVYQSELDADGNIRFICPSTKATSLTGAPPSGFDGGFITYNPDLPAVIFEGGAPNILLGDESELRAYITSGSRMAAHGRAS